MVTFPTVTHRNDLRETRPDGVPRPPGGILLHINRETLHHGAEIALLRDLYLWQYDGAPVRNTGLGA
jgi:hypothetical protein